MNINDVYEKFNNRSARPKDIRHNYGVFLPLIYLKGEWHLIYESRAKSLKNQPGEISFPGGAVEKNETFKEAAIRETCEELNVKKKKIKICNNVIGELDYIITYFNFFLCPFIGTINGISVDDMKYNSDEVDHIFTVPVDFFMNNEPSTYRVDLKAVIKEDFPYELIPGGKEYNFRKGIYSIYFYKYQENIIWGITAKITKNFIDIMKEK